VNPSQGSAGRRALILLFAIGVFGLTAMQAGKAALAAHRSLSQKPEDWLRAAEMEPGNAGFWDRLGMFRTFDLDHAEPALAVQYFKKALALNPRSDLYWMHLASAYEFLGEIDRAREAYREANRVYPISADVDWNYGNFLLRQSQFKEGFAEIHQAVQTDPSLIPLAISRCWRANPDVERLLGDVLPTDVEAYSQALDFLSTSHELGAALTTWNRMLGLGKPLPLARAFPLLDELILQERAEDAKKTWEQALAASGWPTPASQGNSVVGNGGFESEIANGGLGWREQPVTGAEMEVDTAISHSGSQSLRVDFDGSANLDFRHLSQYVAVEPHTRYHFRAYLRTEQILTESGMRFVVLDPHHNDQLQFQTDDLNGTHAWTPVESDVTSGPDTHFLLIQLRRFPSRLFDNKLGGTVWVDDVTLTPAVASAGRVAP
jgi:tetratricopeptide (TPR) repeat protein